MATTKSAMSRANSNRRLPEKHDSPRNTAKVDRVPMSPFPGALLLVRADTVTPGAYASRSEYPHTVRERVDQETVLVKAPHLDITHTCKMCCQMCKMCEKGELSPLVIDSVDENLRFYETSELNRDPSTSINPRSGNWIRRRSGLEKKSGLIEPN